MANQSPFSDNLEMAELQITQRQEQEDVFCKLKHTQEIGLIQLKHKQEVSMFEKEKESPDCDEFEITELHITQRHEQELTLVKLKHKHESELNQLRHKREKNQFENYKKRKTAEQKAKVSDGHFHSWEDEEPQKGAAEPMAKVSTGHQHSAKVSTGHQHSWEDEVPQKEGTFVRSMDATANGRDVEPTLNGWGYEEHTRRRARMED